MIKAVLFDYGGVLTEAGKVGGISAVLAKLYNIEPATIHIADLHDKLLVGAINQEEYFDELNRRYGSQGHEVTAALFNANNAAFETPCRPVYDLAAQLRAAGIRTSILSNIYKLSADRLRAAGLYNHFDPVVLSCDEHTAKPDSLFYERALQKLNLPGSEVLFIDDQQRFMPPKHFGMRTILATSPQQVVRDVKALLLKENNLYL